MSQEKMATYNEIKNFFKIDMTRCLDDNFAYLTHFWHNADNPEITQFYEDQALDYFREITGDSTIDNIPIPSRFDVPFPGIRNHKFTFIDLFAGIGGIRLAYQRLGGKCVFSSEWDLYAKKTYEANFGEVPFGDITKIDANHIPNHDILLAGFPCQPFSIAGVSKKNALGRKHGFLDETQGTLFFDIARILQHKRPLAFMLENVKNLKSHDNKRTFQVIKKTLDELGYYVFSDVIDARHFVPQHRERIIIVGFKKEYYQKNEFAYAQLPSSEQKIKDILVKKTLPKYTLSDKLWVYLQHYAQKHKKKGNGFGFGLTNIESVSRTLSARYYKDGAEILISQEDENPRRLTPRECARLQGFPNTFKITVSDNQAYKQFGNSVAVPLIEFVGAQIIHELKSIKNKYHL